MMIAKQNNCKIIELEIRRIAEKDFQKSTSSKQMNLII